MADPLPNIGDLLTRYERCEFLAGEESDLVAHTLLTLTILDTFGNADSLPASHPIKQLNLELPRSFLDQKRSWILEAVSQLHPLARQHGFDPTPMIWLARWVDEIALYDAPSQQPFMAVSAEDKRRVIDLLANLRHITLRDLDKQSPQPNQPELPTFLPSALAKALCTTTKTLGKYARKAGVPTPGRGVRNFRYPLREAIAIMEAFLAEAPTFYAERARVALAEMEKKSKEWKQNRTEAVHS